MDQDRKEAHRLQMRAYLERDVAEAKRLPCILGIKVVARTDKQWATKTCSRAASFVGVYLPDQVPDLYPEDCPDDDACCCVVRETVLETDNTPEGASLRRAKAAK